MKIRFGITVEDYYDYVGSSSHSSLTKRAKESLPRQIENGYNMKFKLIKRGWHKWYRVHITCIITQEALDDMLADNKVYMHKFENLTYKVLEETTQ